MISEVCIIFGSQTGNSEEYSKRIYRLLKSNGIKATIFTANCIKDIDFLVKQEFIIFSVSTCGQGMEPDNFKDFWLKLLRVNLPAGEWLKKTYCAVLGLGDSSYKKFNFCAKKLYRRLCQLGCKLTIPIGLADEQDEFGIDSTAKSWINELIRFILDKNEIKFQNLSCFPWKTQYSILSTENDKYPTFPQYDIFYLAQNRIITSPDHFQQVNCIELQLGQSASYLPGDCLAIIPKNNSALAQSFLQLFSHINKDEHIQIATSADIEVPECLSISTTFDWMSYYYFDINGTPKPWFFELFHQYATDPVEKNKLLELSKSDFIDEYYSYCTRPRRNFYEVFRDFPHSLYNLKIEDLMELIPQLKPREYSICSSMNIISTQSLSIIVANVKYQTSIKQPRIGIASNYLCSLSNYENCFVYGKIRKGTFKFPNSSETPWIMISTGTGCAAFHAYCLTLTDSPKINPNLIFMGFRNRDKDYLLKESWDKIERTKNVQLILAFSRDDASKKVYVQHKLLEYGNKVWESISNGATIFLSGNAKRMPNDVYECIEEIVSTFGNMNKEQARLYLQAMEKQCRYQTETY